MTAVSVKKVEQPASFAFTRENKAKIPGIIAKYPAGQNDGFTLRSA